MTSYNHAPPRRARLRTLEHAASGSAAPSELHPKVLQGVPGPIISASDNVRALGEQLLPYIEQDYYVLGTDGMGRSETRPALRRHFEVDGPSITIAALYRLSKQGRSALPMLPKRSTTWDTMQKSPTRYSHSPRTYHLNPYTLILTP